MTKDSQAMVSDGEILDLLPDGNYKIKKLIFDVYFLKNLHNIISRGQQWSSED